MAETMGTQGEGRRTKIVAVLGADEEPVLMRWCTTQPYDYTDPLMPPPPGPYSVVDSYALRTAEGWVLVDPQVPAPDVVGRLWQTIGEHPLATLLTNDWHERSCYVIREERGVPVWAASPSLPERGGQLDGRPDHTFEDGDTLPGGIHALKVPGLRAGDTVFHWRAPGGPGVLLTGDVINEQLEPEFAQPYHPRPEWRLYFGASANYLDRHRDPDGLRVALRRLLEEDFGLLCGSHSVPYGDDPKAEMQRLIAEGW